MCNKLKGKTIIWNGDSICAGSEIVGNWAKIIVEKYGVETKNYAVGGGTIGFGFPNMKSGNPRHSVLKTVDVMYEEYPDADYVILEGGTNDADLVSRGDSEVTLGSFDPQNYSGNYDLTTFCGCLETLFYKALKYWNGKKIGFIVAHKMGTAETSRRNRRLYFDKAVEICKKWGIPYVDLWEGSYLNPCLPWMYNPDKTADENRADNTGYYSDGQHLTARGYEFTAEIIETWLNTL